MALFGKLLGRRPAEAAEQGVYLLMDSSSKLLARGRRMDAPGRKNIYIKLIDGDVKTVVDAGVIQAVPQDKSLPPQMTRVVNFRPDAVALEPMRDLGADVRRNFRVPVEFDSFVYPPAGGQVAIRSVDLSCGGVAFHSPRLFTVGDVFEVVIPMTSEGPVILTCQTLRVRPDPVSGNFCACKFIDMINDEESFLREAVFAIQIRAAKYRK